MRLSRRRFLGSAVAAVPAGAGWAKLLEPHWIEVKRTRLPAAGAPLPRAVRILHLSDLHLSGVVPLPLITRAIRLGVAEKPDLVCVTGDFITSRLGREKEFAAALRELADAAPAYATMGNHDGGRWAGLHGGYPDSAPVRAFAAEAGLRVLHNDSALVRLGGTALRLTGLGDAWAGEIDPPAAFARARAGHADAHVVLSHNPDTKGDLRPFAWDLMLCGHTHGGQVSLPFLGGGLFAPVRDKRYISGLHRWDGRHLYVSRGIGSILGLRFNCRPEVTILDLV